MEYQDLLFGYYKKEIKIQDFVENTLGANVQVEQYLS